MLISLLLTTCLCLTNISAKGLYFQRFISIIFENQPYKNVIKNNYFKSLTSEGVSFTNFQALRNPSYPNYIGMIGGSTFDITSDKQTILNETSLPDLLETKGYNWKAYTENYRGNCFLGDKDGKYARKHVPFLSFAPIIYNTTRCNKIVNSKDFSRDWNLRQIPSYAMYIPNLDNDGHDTNIAFAAKWLQQFLAPILSDTQQMNDTLLLITFDEGKKGNNQIFNVLIGSNIKKGSVFTTKSNHYTMLKLVEDNFQLGNLGRNDASANPVVSIFQS